MVVLAVLSVERALMPCGDIRKRWNEGRLRKNRFLDSLTVGPPSTPAVLLCLFPESCSRPLMSRLSSVQLLLQNFNRVRRCILFLINAGCYINSCFEWHSPQRSICAFLVLTHSFPYTHLVYDTVHIGYIYAHSSAPFSY